MTIRTYGNYTREAIERLHGRIGAHAAPRALLELIAHVEELETRRVPEVVICAAIRLPDGRILRGHRHGDCIRTARESVNWNRGVSLYADVVGDPPMAEYWQSSMSRDQGFITSRNRYVDRHEGMRLQRDAGIESVAPGGYRGQLYSEDLY